MTPLSMCKKLGGGIIIKPTSMTLQTAGKSVKFLDGILEDVPVKVVKLHK